jgi:hypothetical protein
MFAFNTFFADSDVKVTAQAAFKTMTVAQAPKGASASDVSLFNDMREYIALLYAFEAVGNNLNERAASILKQHGATVQDLAAISKSYKTMYANDYAVRFPNNDAKKKEAAVNMAWSRFMGRAAVAGWTKPTKTGVPKVKSTAKRGKGAVAAAKKTAANATAVANAATDTPANAAMDKPATVVDVAIASAIVADGDADSDLIVALRWVRESDENTQAFVAWFKEQKAAALMGAVTPSIVVPVTTRKRGAKAA